MKYLFLGLSFLFLPIQTSEYPSVAENYFETAAQEITEAIVMMVLDYDNRFKNYLSLSKTNKYFQQNCVNVYRTYTKRKLLQIQAHSALLLKPLTDNILLFDIEHCNTVRSIYNYTDTFLTTSLAHLFTASEPELTYKDPTCALGIIFNLSCCTPVTLLLIHPHAPVELLAFCKAILQTKLKEHKHVAFKVVIAQDIFACNFTLESAVLLSKDINKLDFILHNGLANPEKANNNPATHPFHILQKLSAISCDFEKLLEDGNNTKDATHELASVFNKHISTITETELLLLSFVSKAFRLLTSHKYTYAENNALLKKAYYILSITALDERSKNNYPE